MQRRSLIRAMAAAAAGFAVFACDRKGSALAAAPDTAPGDFAPLSKATEEWRAILPPNRFAILFEDGTERPFSSPLDRENRDGTFVCAACYLPLFLSSAKFDSGTGWPSFTGPIPKRTASRQDFKLVIPRLEYHCARCGGHQGHVFEDGPPPKGERWCNNGLALEFVPSSSKLPALRT